MNTAQVLAWLVCLALAFFACVLSVLNMGSRFHVERDLETMREELNALREPSALSPRELDLVRRTLAGIRADLRETEQLNLPEAEPRLREGLAAVDAKLRELEALFAKPPQRSSP